MAETPPAASWANSPGSWLMLALFLLLFVVSPIHQAFFSTPENVLGLVLTDANVTDVSETNRHFRYHLDGQDQPEYNFREFVAADPAARKGYDEDVGWDASDLSHYLCLGDRLTKAANSPHLTVHRGSVVTHWVLATAVPPAPRYAGTYVVMDTAVCALSITVTRQATGYRFRSGQWQGPVTVVREGANTYFTFVGLKGIEPKADISAAWVDTALLIQNYGNSMNNYERFSCDAKYLTLRRQQP